MSPGNLLIPQGAGGGSSPLLIAGLAFTSDANFAGGDGIFPLTPGYPQLDSPDPGRYAFQTTGLYIPQVIAPGGGVAYFSIRMPTFSRGTVTMLDMEIDVSNSDGTEVISCSPGNAPLDLPSDLESFPTLVKASGTGTDLSVSEDTFSVVTAAGGTFFSAAWVRILVSDDFA